MSRLVVPNTADSVTARILVVAAGTETALLVVALVQRSGVAVTWGSR
jgi:hypothetical protein